MRPSNPHRPASFSQWRGRGLRTALPPARMGGWFSSSGFTLLEMLLVLFIMALVASAATFMTEGLDTQNRHDETRRRIEMVKRAIAGDPVRNINSQPDVRGFVADIGRLPASLEELLQQGTLPVFAQDATSGLWSGWRGPYLETGGLGKFHDGYGNPGVPDDSDPNYGWTFNVASGVVALSSVGATSDSADDVGASELLVADDYQLPLATVKINFHNRRGNDSVLQSGNLRLRVYSPTEGVVGGDDSDAFSLAAMSAVQSVQATATFTPQLDVPIGARAYAVLCVDTGKIFDGDCDAGNADPAAVNAMHFTVAPRAQPTAFDWIMQ